MPLSPTVDWSFPKCVQEHGFTWDIYVRWWAGDSLQRWNAIYQKKP